MNTYQLKKTIHDTFFSDICQPTINSLSDLVDLYRNKDGVLVKKLDMLQSMLDKTNSEIDSYKQDISNLLKENKVLKEGGIPEHPMETYWNNKHPQANIYYIGRPSLVRPDENQRVDVKLMLTPTDFVIHSWLKSKKLYVKDPLHIDSFLPELYYQHQKSWFHYVHDGKNTLGHGEYWMYPYELREKRQANAGGDCDDYAISLVSHYIAAGVPEWRVRVVVGGTTGHLGGHATTYVLSDDLKTWHHFNSTSLNRFLHITDAPKFGDKSDSIGIDPNNVWFSFNNKHAWHQFETNASRADFNKEGKRLFKIERIK